MTRIARGRTIFGNAIISFSSSSYRCRCRSLALQLLSVVIGKEYQSYGHRHSVDDVSMQATPHDPLRRRMGEVSVFERFHCCLLPLVSNATAGITDAAGVATLLQKDPDSSA